MTRPSLGGFKPTYWKRTSAPRMSSVAMWGTCSQGQGWHSPWAMCKSFLWKMMGPFVMCSQQYWILDTISLVSTSPFWIPICYGISWKSSTTCVGKNHRTKVLSVDECVDSCLDLKTPIVPLEDLPYTLSMVATINSQLGIRTIQSNCPLSSIDYTEDDKTSAQVNSARVTSPLCLTYWRDVPHPSFQDPPHFLSYYCLSYLPFEQ